jgi:hypothetical protein
MKMLLYGRVVGDGKSMVIFDDFYNNLDVIELGELGLDFTFEMRDC